MSRKNDTTPVLTHAHFNWMALRTGASVQAVRHHNNYESGSAAAKIGRMRHTASEMTERHIACPPLVHARHASKKRDLTPPVVH